MMDLPFRTAFFTNAIQTNLMPCGSEARCFLELFRQKMVYWQVKISNAAAVLADEVMMRQGRSLEPVIAASEVEFAYQPLFHENPQIPIHCAQTQVPGIAFVPCRTPTWP